MCVCMSCTFVETGDLMQFVTWISPINMTDITLFQIPPSKIRFHVHFWCVLLYLCFCWVGYFANLFVLRCFVCFAESRILSCLIYLALNTRFLVTVAVWIRKKGRNKIIHVCWCRLTSLLPQILTNEVSYLWFSIRKQENGNVST